MTVLKVCSILCLAKLLYHQHVLRVHFTVIDFFFSPLEEKSSVSMPERKEQLIANYKIVYQNFWSSKGGIITRNVLTMVFNCLYSWSLDACFTFFYIDTWVRSGS